MAEKPWRPPDWERHYPAPDKLPIFDKNSLCDCTIFEAGADAMLEALKEQALYRNLLGMQSASDNAVICPSIPNEKGWIVFIPDQ